MKTVNKAILVPVLSAVALLAKFVIGYEIPDVAVDLSADIIMGLISLVGIFMNPKKGASPEVVSAIAATSASIQETTAAAEGAQIKKVSVNPMSFNEVLPYLEGISKDLTDVFDALKSGKYNTDTQKALDTAIAIHDFLKQQKGGIGDAAKRP